jgi:hypothetical protein
MAVTPPLLVTEHRPYILSTVIIVSSPNLTNVHGVREPTAFDTRTWVLSFHIYQRHIIDVGVSTNKHMIQLSITALAVLKMIIKWTTTLTLALCHTKCAFITVRPTTVMTLTSKITTPSRMPNAHSVCPSAATAYKSPSPITT